MIEVLFCKYKLIFLAVYIEYKITNDPKELAETSRLHSLLLNDKSLKN